MLSIYTTKAEAKATLPTFPWGFCNLSPALRNDPEIIMLAIEHWGHNLYSGPLTFADDSIRRNPEIISAAITKNGLDLQYASPELQADPTIAKTAVSQNGLALRYVPSTTMQKNHDIVLAAVKQNGLALEYALEEHQADLDIVRAAVTKNGSALQYASDKCQGRLDIVMCALSSHCNAMYYAARDLSLPALIRKIINGIHDDLPLAKDAGFFLRAHLINAMPGLTRQPLGQIVPIEPTAELTALGLTIPRLVNPIDPELQCKFNELETTLFPNELGHSPPIS